MRYSWRPLRRWYILNADKEFKKGGPLTNIYTIVCQLSLYQRTPSTMSDLFYPQAVASNKCNTILTFIPASRYSVSVRADEPMGLLLEATPPSTEPSIKCRFPRHYVPHLERFLWRYYLFYGLYEYFHVKQQSKLNQFGIGFFQRMLVMMNAVLGQLVTTCSKNPNSRSTYFDDYLVTEFIVGCHDPQSVDAWRKNPYHVNLDLERIPPDFLGKW